MYSVMYHFQVGVALFETISEGDTHGTKVHIHLLSSMWTL